MFKTVASVSSSIKNVTTPYRFFYFEFLSFDIVCGLRLENSTDFVFRISNLFSATKNTKFTTDGLISL